MPWLAFICGFLLGIVASVGAFALVIRYAIRVAKEQREATNAIRRATFKGVH